MTARRRTVLYWALYLALVTASVVSLGEAGDLTLGRHPGRNLLRTVAEMARPSFVDAWVGDPHFEYRDDQGVVLRTEDKRQVERSFLASLARGAWQTVRTATLGSLLGALLGVVPGLLVASNLGAPRPLAWTAKALLDGTRSVHTLVFGLLYVGIMGLGSMAGILAIASHCLGTFGKLYAEAIESTDMAAVEAVRATGAGPVQTFVAAVWPAVRPQIISTNLYVWEFNVRDSTILGLVGAGGLGLLASEAVSLFQWGRLSTILLVIIAMVLAFDGLSRKIRRELA